ncbi:MAG: metal-dependent hydrolase, partial [Halodesulfurarchaeum sp.]
MDFLSHLFLPLLVAYVLRPEWFDSPWALAVGVFGLLPDFDKFLRMPGLGHSLVTLVPIWVGVLVLERRLRGELRWSLLIGALSGSHLVLDFVDGGPVPLLYPFIKEGVGLKYPAITVFGTATGVTIRDSLVSL